MTIDTQRPVPGTAASADEELLAGLWDEAPFPRLPWDAPSELRDFVEDVDNPRRVYSVHRASRRHNFQLIVQKYIVQLREGCGVSTCTIPTCLSCRKRIAGRAPLRRYNTTSARTLAIHLASQDNPEAGLCPALRLPKAPPAALGSLIFTPKYVSSSREDGTPGSYKAAPIAYARGGTAKDQFRPGKRAADGGHTALNTKGTSTLEREHDRELETKPSKTAHGEASQRTGPGPILGEPAFTVTDKPVSKDYRSFAANMFGTVAFKMLEWLTPASVEEMTEVAEKLQDGATPSHAKRRPSHKVKLDTAAEKGHSVTGAMANGSAVPVGQVGDGSAVESSAKKEEPTDTTSKPGGASPQPSVSTSPRPFGHPNANGNALRNASARLRPPALARQPAQPQQRKMSVDQLTTDLDDVLPLRSPRTTGAPTDIIGKTGSASKPAKTSTAAIPLPISQLSSAGFFDSVSLEKMPPPKATEAKSKVRRSSQVDVSMRSGSDSSVPQSRSSSAHSLSSDHSSSDQSAPRQDADGEDTALDDLLPQTLTRLDADIVNFVCDVLQEDGTAEPHMLEPSTVVTFHTLYEEEEMLRRKQKHRSFGQGARLRKEWRLFIEQSFFFVLSDPHKLIGSFTEDGLLYDTHSLWYCMMRLTRVAPSLVLHSLWMAAEALFDPSGALLAQRFPLSRLRPGVVQALLTDWEAGVVMSICLHALSALAPVVDDTRKLYDMSRVRSQGLSLSGSNSVTRQPIELCLQYEDAFSNELAIRLARRLFAAIHSRRLMREMTKDTNRDSSIEHGDTANNLDILEPLFAQLDFLNTNAAYVLGFTVPDRILHETRVPTLLLDWARVVMLQDWNGNPEVPGDGPFGGALVLIEAIYVRRHELLIGNAQFRSEYFAERLDEVDVPVAWLSFKSTREKRHLLDFPFMFSPDTLISYFRSINFSRMSRSFEESSSLQSRMNAIVSPGSLVTNPHHRSVLQDLLRTASTKYLVLDIGRVTVLQDAFDQLWRRERRELLRPLKVHLGEDGGEEGFDSGGVQQEFFRLALAEALDPDYGAFTVDARTHMAWFNPMTLEEDWKFELIGLLISLALFNGLSLPVTFPKALYRKLLGEPVTELHHISDGWPELASGLTALLEWNEQEGAVEDVFVRTYEFSVDMLGQPITRVMRSGDGFETWPRGRDLIEGAASALPASHGADDGKSGDEDGDGGNAGDENDDGNGNDSGADNGDAAVADEDAATVDAAATKDAAAAENATPTDDEEGPMVTGDNRHAYVSDYIRYLTDVTVRPQYEAFSRGFRRCLHPKSLTLLTSALLQPLVEGQQEIDVEELRQHARYVGWDASHRTVRDFWGIVSEYDERAKRRLLEFVTASDRVPVGGIKNLQFVVQRNGEEEGEHGHLPTAYTCYGTMLLPEYPSQAVLRERLAMALNNAQGFGFA